LAADAPLERRARALRFDASRVAEHHLELDVAIADAVVERRCAC
jgi:hypothetical protein